MKRYNKDGYHAEHDEGAFVLYEDARREIDELKTRLAEADAQREGLRNKLAKVEAQHIYVYNSGYRAGHHDTVEGWYVDIHHSDMTSYHAEEVAELREALAKPEEK